MGSRYLPPHLRKQNDTHALDARSADDVHSTQVFARRCLSDLKLSGDAGRPRHTLDELNHHFGGSVVQSTLRDSATSPGKLAFVILFRNANPRWRSDRIIFAHTNINMLPGYEKFKQQLQNDSTKEEEKGSQAVPEASEAEPNKKGPDLITKEPAHLINSSNTNIDITATANPPSDDSVKNLTDPIPVFMEIGRQGGRNFIFHGYFPLTRVEFLKPQSPDLVRMLQQKWQTNQRNPNIPPSYSKKRDAAAWANSLKQEWVVLQFGTIPDDEIPEDPKIEILPDQSKSFDAKENVKPGITHEASQNNAVVDEDKDIQAVSPEKTVLESGDE